jgi:hypothetical protein
MKPHAHKDTGFRGPLAAFVLYATLSALFCGVFFLVDIWPSPLTLSEAFAQSIAEGSLGGLPEVIAGILGISITVVAIIVELASNRYTARITELFISSLVNISVLGFFVVTGVLCIWAAVTTVSGLALPTLAARITIAFTVLCLLLLLPYFAFVFNFLNPHNIIYRMAASVLTAIRRGGTPESRKYARRCRKKQLVVTGIEQLADVASGAIENKDKVVCMEAVNTLGSLVSTYINEKSRLHADWFALESAIQENPDFVSMHKDAIADIANDRYWLEMKVLRQFQTLYGEAINRMRDINYLIAINTRRIAEVAMQNDDAPVVMLCVKFFNTYMRATINAKDLRTAYNVFNQYRLLGESAIAKGQSAVAIEIAERFKYYGQLGFASGLSFVLETAAYDLCDLNEMAHQKSAPCTDDLLGIFLDVDKEAEEGHALEASLRGVRKAQVKLAAYFISCGDMARAKIIFEDMRDELPGRLRSIQEELAKVTSRDFWEISDRGGNFDYLSPERRTALDTFFSWFAGQHT